MLMLNLWFERTYAEEVGMPAQQKMLPTGNTEKELAIDFNDWNNPSSEKDIVIEEYLWGVRCGIMQFVNPDNCSFAAVLAVARTDEMCEIYSPAKVCYYSDGSRKIIPHNISVYNTDAHFGCYKLINIEQAANLFPQYEKIFQKLPPETIFLCSPDGDKIRIANQEKGEIGFSFNAVDTDIPEKAFYLGTLRATFQYIAQEIANGNGLSFCKTEETHSLDYLRSKICLMSGSKYHYNLATSLAAEAHVQKIRQSYIAKGITGKDKFTLLIKSITLLIEKSAT